MKRSSSSINNKRDVNSSQSKRIRENTPMRQEEEVQHIDDDSIGFSSQKKVVKVKSKNLKETTSRDEIDDNTYPNITTSTPSGSSISFSSSSSKTAPALSKNTIPSSKGTSSSLDDKSSSLSRTTSSLKSTSSSSDDTSPSSSSSKVPSSSSNNTTSLTEFNKKSHCESNPSSQLQGKNLRTADGIVNTSVVSENGSTKQISIKEKKKSASLNTSSTDAFNRKTADSYSKVLSTSSSTNKNQTTTARNSFRCSTVNHLSAFDRASSSSSSTSLNDSNNSNKTTFPIQSLVEGSLEYREMKRKYLKEQENAEEWRKDYNVLKQQLAHLKSTTIPRPTAEVMEWLQELFELINQNGKFKGDEQTLNKIGKKLVLDKTSLVTVHARTPQKSSLKLFRLLYPTIGSRARCGSISQVPKEQLDYIYLYVRNLHKNLNFSRNDMRKAIGTCIRAANSKLRKFEHFQQQDENVDPDEPTNDTSDIENALDGTEDITDDEEEKEDDDEAEAEDEDEDENDDKEVNNLMIDDELDEADE